MLLAAAFGLGQPSPPLAAWPVIGAYGGDAAWAMAAYAGWRLLLPVSTDAGSPRSPCGLATTVEVSQLARLGLAECDPSEPARGATAGPGISLVDLVAYAVGTIAAMALGSLTGCASPTSLRPDSPNGLRTRLPRDDRPEFHGLEFDGGTFALQSDPAGDLLASTASF